MLYRGPACRFSPSKNVGGLQAFPFLSSALFVVSPAVGVIDLILKRLPLVYDCFLPLLQAVFFVVLSGAPVVLTVGSGW